MLLRLVYMRVHIVYMRYVGCMGVYTCAYVCTHLLEESRVEPMSALEAHQSSLRVFDAVTLALP